MKKLAGLVVGVALAIATAASAETPYDAPFKAGQTATYVASQHMAAAKVDVTYKYPSAWSVSVGGASDGQAVMAPDRKFVCLLILKDEIGVDAKTFQTVFTTPNLLNAFMPAGSEVISSNAKTIAGLPAGELIFMTGPTEGRPAAVAAVDDFFVVNNTMVSFQCMAVAADLATAKANLDAALPLFRQMAETVTISPK